MPSGQKSHEQFRPIFYFMKHLTVRMLAVSTLMLFVLTASAEKIDTSIGDLKYQVDTETKEATVTGGVGNNLYSVSIPDSIGYESINYPITRVGKEAFKGYRGLTTVSLGNCLKVIEDNAFEGCVELVKLDMPNSLETIKGGAFASCGFSVVEIADGVKEIGENAFYSSSTLNSVKIGKSVTTIGRKAFSECPALTSVTLGENLKFIKTSAFERCTVLSDIILPSSLQVIDSRAFHSTALVSVSVPSSVVNIGKDAFNDIYALKEIKVDEANTVYSDIDGVLCSKTKTVLLRYPNSKGKTYTVPNTIKKIYDGAFSYCPELETVVFPASVISFGNNIFASNSKLKSITIFNPEPATLESSFNVSDVFILVPKQSVNLYRNTYRWQDMNIKAIGSIAENITMGAAELTLEVGSESQLQCTVLPETAENKTVTWNTTDANVVTVDEMGNLIAVSEGEAIVSATTNDGTNLVANCKIKVVGAKATDINQFKDVIYVENTKAFIGKNATLSIRMKHETDVAGFQFNMLLPEGFSIKKISRGEGISGLDENDENIYTFKTSDKKDGSRFFLCYSVTNTAMPKGDIEIAKVEVNVPENIEAGEYGVILKKEEMAFGTESKKVDFVNSMFTVADCILGDVNKDGIITVSDITSLGQYLIDNDDTVINKAAADANGDGEVTVGDITTIATMIIEANKE